MLVVLFERLPLWLKQKVCAYLAPGHSYTVEMIRLEDESFVLDPVANCRHCSLPLPDRIYARLVTEIHESDALDSEEDEVW